MGLDLNTGWGMSYGSFHLFRTMIAEAAGINLDQMAGFGGSIQWKTIKDNIKWLLDHSDCEGKISARRCGLTAPRLKELAPALKDDYYREKAEELAEDMEAYSDRGNGLGIEFG